MASKRKKKDVTEQLAAEPAEPELHTLGCDHCGGDAITAAAFTDGDGRDVGCATCKFPGHVSVDEPDSEEDVATATWLITDDPAARCQLDDCAECHPAPVIVRIALTDRRPVEVDAAEWHMVARAPMIDAWDIATLKQSDASFVTVIEHNVDGRRIVFGRRGLAVDGTARSTYAGWVVDAPGNGVGTASIQAVVADKRTIECIRGVAVEIGAGPLASECIAALPAERL